VKPLKWFWVVCGFPLGVGLIPHLWGSIVGNSQSFQKFNSQTIQGSFPLFANQKVKFGVFDGFKCSNYISCKR
jgi:hypothetical protein